MREAFVVGQPISHTLSPVIFAHIAHALNMSDEFKYDARDVSSEKLPHFVTSLRENSNLVGVNVTLPHKETVLDLLDVVSDEAKAIGAVNVVRQRDGLLEGFNTDVSGILQTFEKHHLSFAEKNALIIGAGGAARANAKGPGRWG